MSAQTVTVAAPPTVEGIDPATLKQVAGLSLKLFGAIASKNYAAAFGTAIQIAGLVADAFDTSPAPAPIGGPDELPAE